MHIEKFVNFIFKRICRGCRYHFSRQIVPYVNNSVWKEILELLSVKSGLVKFEFMGSGVRMGKC